MLGNKTFFSWELVPIIDAALEAAYDHPNRTLLNQLRMQLDVRADKETNGEVDPVAISPGTALYIAINSALRPFSMDRGVLNALAAAGVMDTPVTKMPSKPLVVGLLLAVGLGAYYGWTNKGALWR